MSSASLPDATTRKWANQNGADVIPSPAHVRLPQRRPIATIAIIAINVAVFLYQQSLSSLSGFRFVLNWSLIPARFTHPGVPVFDIVSLGPSSPRLLTVVTSLFLHAGLAHIALNMFLLLAIGRMVEMVIGTPRFVLLYSIAGLASSIAVILLYRDSTTPFVGASGAVYGVLGAYFLLLPPGPDRTKTIVWTLALILLPALIPARVIRSATGSDFLANIAHWAHVGGFLAGVLAMDLMIRAARHRAAHAAMPEPSGEPAEPLPRR